MAKKVSSYTFPFADSPTSTMKPTTLPQVPFTFRMHTPRTPNTITHTRVPLEIAELIIDEVAALNDNFVTLRSCALSNRSFLKRSRQHLFRSIPLTYQASYPVAIYLRLYDVLRSSPELAKLVLEFHIDEDICVAEFDDHVDPCFISQPTLPELLLMLPCMTTFSMCFESSSASGQDWEKLSHDLRCAILMILCRDCISDLRLDNMSNLPKSLSTLILGIRTVTLLDVEFSTQEQQFIIHTKPNAGSLEELTISDLDPIHEPVFHSLIMDVVASPSCKLKKLCTSTDGFEWTQSSMKMFAIGSKILLAHQNNITTLGLSLGSTVLLQSGNPIDPDFDVGILLHLCVIRFYTRNNCDDVVGISRQILSKARPGNVIQQVIFDFPRHLDCASFLESYQEHEWRALDELLSGLQFASLRKLYFIFPPPLDGTTGEDEEKRKEYLAALLNIPFPKTHELGILDFCEILTITPVPYSDWRLIFNLSSI
ncbi:hypothetical protein BDQ17DRAFT_1429459 [Cyathus striatus]|nr:hypothetical protein BDQ17DRAFT_1429459 [Cyathus striatus]